MITFKQFIAENSRAKSIDTESALLWMSSESKDFLKSGVHLYRGIESEVPEGILSGSSVGERPRESKNTSNYYTLWMDNHPSFKDWPKRSRSFICTTRPHYAEEFGAVYIMVPSDKAKVGKVGKGDIWGVQLGIGKIGGTAVRHYVIHPNELNDLLDDILTTHVKTYDDLAQALKNVKYEHIKSARLADQMLLTGSDDMFQFVEKLLVPSAFAGTCDAGDLTLTTNGECWVEGEAVFIPTNQHQLSAYDQHQVLEWAKDYPSILEVLSKYWEESPEDANNDSSFGHVDPDSISTDDVLTTSHRKQR